MSKEITGLSTCVGIKLVDVSPMTKEEFYKTKKYPLDSNDASLKDAGYQVEYEDGYISWSPKDTFDKAHRTILDMTWSMALYLVVRGSHVARAGWNGKGMHIEYVEATENFGAYFIIVDAAGKANTWVPSVSDNLADDWMITAE